MIISEESFLLGLIREKRFLFSNNLSYSKMKEGGILRKKLETELKALEPFFTYLIEENENLEEASIDISAVKANILIFAGKDDQLWPSYKMAQKNHRRTSRKKIN